MSAEGVGSEIATGLARHLTRSDVPPDLFGVSDERCFQRWVAKRTEEWLKGRHRGGFWTKGEASGGGVAPVLAFGGGSWPDVTVGSEDWPTAVAIEVKCLKKRGLPNRIAHAVGQALMYREMYDRCLVVFAVIEDIAVEIPRTLLARLSENGITVVVVRAFPAAGVAVDV